MWAPRSILLPQESLRLMTAGRSSPFGEVVGVGGVHRLVIEQSEEVVALLGEPQAQLLLERCGVWPAAASVRGALSNRSAVAARDLAHGSGQGGRPISINCERCAAGMWAGGRELASCCSGKPEAWGRQPPSAGGVPHPRQLISSSRIVLRAAQNNPNVRSPIRLDRIKAHLTPSPGPSPLGPAR